MKALVVASSDGELISFKKLNSVITLSTGLGNILSSSLVTKAISEEKPEVVFSIGSAGRNTNSMVKEGEVVSFKNIYSYDQDLTSLGFLRGETVNGKRKKFGRIATADDKSNYIILSSSSLVDNPMFPLFFDAFDMESYGVAVASKIFSIPFYVVKVITDTLGDEKSKEDISLIYKEKRDELTQVVKGFLC